MLAFPLQEDLLWNIEKQMHKIHIAVYSNFVFEQPEIKELDDALVEMIIKDCQPFFMVEEKEFCAFFFRKLEPVYRLQS